MVVHENGGPKIQIQTWSTRAISVADCSGSFIAMRYLHSYGWPQSTGHLEMESQFRRESTRCNVVGAAKR
jgi:hypothetical protein